MEEVTELLAQFLVKTDFEDLPAQAVTHSKRCLLDFLGVSIVGATMEHSRMLASFVKDLGGAQEATVIGHPFKAPCPSAGLVNGATGHALQMDDTEWTSIAHLGTTVIPAALALAEKEGALGKEVLTAIVLGYEGAIRIAAAINPSHNSRGFCANGTIGVFGAAIAAAKILRLGKDRMCDAIGSAAMQSSGLDEFGYDGSMSSILISGHAAQAGIISALLAQRGFTGSHTILEGRSGFFQAYSDRCEVSKTTAGLGERYRILDVWFKRYPTCAYSNAALDAILDLVSKHEIGEDDVREVRIKTYAAVEKTVNNPRPTNVTAAMLSLPYAAAVAIAERRVTPQEFTAQRLSDERINALARKVKLLVADEQLNEFAAGRLRGAIVEILCQDDRRYEGRVKAPKGDNIDPFTEEELLSKFETLASPLADAGRIDAIANTVRSLEEVDDMRDLTELLCFVVRPVTW